MQIRPISRRHYLVGALFKFVGRACGPATLKTDIRPSVIDLEKAGRRVRPQKGLGSEIFRLHYSISVNADSAHIETTLPGRCTIQV